MSDLKQWAAVKDNIVLHGFDAPQDLIDNFTERVVARADVETPPWYDETVMFLDVTGMDPRPWGGFYKAGNGRWVNGTPALTASRSTIPADSTTAAVVTFTQKGPNAPTSVVFDVNGVQSTVPFANDAASVEVVSATPGDVITVSVGPLSVQVEVL